jgi:hypothetical protein
MLREIWGKQPEQIFTVTMAQIRETIPLETPGITTIGISTSTIEELLEYNINIYVRDPLIPLTKSMLRTCRKCETRTNIVRRSWVIPHRKLGYNLPGRIRKAKEIATCRNVTLDSKLGRIISLIDTSGSTFYTLLPKFGIEETLAIAYMLGIRNIIIIEWDIEVRNNIRINKSLELGEEVIIKIRGGGGTVIDPALEYVIKIAQGNDLVFVFTDGYISISNYTSALAKTLANMICGAYIFIADSLYINVLNIYFNRWKILPLPPLSNVAVSLLDS